MKKLLVVFVASLLLLTLASCQEEIASTEIVSQSIVEETNDVEEVRSDNEMIEEILAHKGSPIIGSFPEIENFDLHYNELNESALVTYNHQEDGFLAISYYAVPATPEVIKEITDKDDTDFNLFREQQMNQGNQISPVEFLEMDGRTVQYFYSTQEGENSFQTHEHHILSGEYLVIIISADILGAHEADREMAVEQLIKITP